MKTAHVLLASLFVASTSARPALVLNKRDVDPSLVPDLGLQAGLNPTGTGDCDGIPGANGVPIKIPCDCPPSRQVLLQALNANVAAGHAVNNPSVKVTFPTDSSFQAQQDRITAVAITLQNLDGPGKGCPIVSTTLTAQSQAIAAAQKAAESQSQSQPPPPPQTHPASQSSSSVTKLAQSSVAPSSTPPPPPPPPLPTATAAPSSSPSLAINPALVPDLGLQSGLNPTGTGDCDGIPGSDGVPIKIPCQCPPNRTTLLNSLSANVVAGHAVNNPSVKISFPTDNSVNSQLARITAVVITLQNLDGPGKGCPLVSTTLAAQAQAIQDAASSSSAAAQHSSTTAHSSTSTSASASTIKSSTASSASASGSAGAAKSGSSNLSNTPQAPAPAPSASASSSANSCPAASNAASGASSSQSQSVNLSNSHGNNNQNAANSALPSTNVTLDPALVPDLGAVAGVNPTGTGDCDGVVKQANGQPVKVPCSCPPDRTTFIAALNANVAAGHAIHNPSVTVSFPLGNNSHAQFDRIEAAIVTLQNLNGPGQGCPVASTTLGQQQAAVLDDINNSR